LLKWRQGGRKVGAANRDAHKGLCKERGTNHPFTKGKKKA